MDQVGEEGTTINFGKREDMKRENAVYQVDNVLGGRGPVRFPSDSLSAKEKRALNGELKTYQTGGPVKYDVFKAWPDDIKKEYLKKCIWDYGATCKQIGEMLGISKVYVQEICKKLGVEARHRGSRKEIEAIAAREKWTRFIAGGKTTIKDIVPEETKAKLEEMIEVSADPATNKAPAPSAISNAKNVNLESPREEKKSNEQIKTPKQFGTSLIALATFLESLRGSGAHITFEVTL